MRRELRAEGWRTVEGASVRGQAFDNGRLLSAEDLADRFATAADDPDPGSSIEALASDLEGFFAAVVAAESSTFLVSDRARSIPLYYATDGTVLSDSGRYVREAIDAQADPITESEFLLTRYVTGPETVWSGVSAVQPGEVVELAEGTVRGRQYWEYWPTPIDDASDPIATLRSGFETALERTERVADGRPIVVPLSGGYDSRLLAAGLTARGNDVVAFTFGRSGHPDVEMSREVADRLGIRWEFVEYTDAAWREWYHGEACRRYRERAFGGDALPFLAEWPAVNRLVEEGRVPDDALFCPGHTVATPSERLPSFAESVAENGSGGRGSGAERGIDPTLDALVEYVLDEHYSLWEFDDETFESVARRRIERGLLGDRPADTIVDAETAAAAYERWEWAGRMTTFTNGDLRVYEDAGVEWWLPLWDPAYVRAWTGFPLAARRNKRLHRELAIEQYLAAADVSPERAAVTDRSLSPFDRHLALVRHSPSAQFTERGGDWAPPFLAPRRAWNTPGSHPLGWDGVVASERLDGTEASPGFYALRTLAATGRIDLNDPDASTPPGGVLTLPTEGS